MVQVENRSLMRTYTHVFNVVVAVNDKKRSKRIRQRLGLPRAEKRFRSLLQWFFSILPRFFGVFVGPICCSERSEQRSSYTKETIYIQVLIKKGILYKITNHYL